MAKTNWTEGSRITPAFMLAYAGNTRNTGHTHDETQDEGSAPKVLLTAGAHVTGLLPNANFAPAVGEVQVKVVTTYVDTQINFAIAWIKSGQTVTLICNSGAQGLDTGANPSFQITPDNTWDADIIPPPIFNALEIPVVIQNDGTIETGILIPPTSVSGNMVIKRNVGNFTGTGSKGIRPFTVTYIGSA